MEERQQSRAGQFSYQTTIFKRFGHMVNNKLVRFLSTTSDINYLLSGLRFFVDMQTSCIRMNARLYGFLKRIDISYHKAYEKDKDQIGAT